MNGKSTGSRIYQLGIASLLGMGGAIATEQISIAQSLIVPDNTLGEEKSRLTPNVEIRGRLSDRISGGARRGGNLFHSFEQFDIPEGRGAYFENPAEIQNIFSRVTGGDPSEINGTLGVIQEGSSDILGNANLFFINPNGIVFGQNARLDVGGSFAATTAEAIEFAEQGVFSSSNPTVPELLTINPSAFLFNQISAQPITQYGSSDGANPINAGLRVPMGANLVLLGGNVTVDRGQLNAPGGRVEIGSVAGTGRVDLNSDGSLSFSDQLERADVTFSNAAQVNVSSSNDGDIAITARNISVQESALLAGINLSVGSANNRAGNITLDATKAIQIDASLVWNLVSAGVTGNSGDIQINTSSLALTNGALVVASTLGQGDSGNIQIDADTLIVSDGSLLSTGLLGQGNSGNLLINVRDTATFTGSSPNGQILSGARSRVERTGEGNAGNVEINTGTLNVEDGAQLSAGSFGQGNAGTVMINAREGVNITGSSRTGFSSGIFSTVEANAVGLGGDIQITTEHLNIANGGTLRASVQGEGSAGDIRLSTNTLTITSGGQISAASFGQGDAGIVSIQANDAIVLSGSGSVGSRLTGVFSTIEPDAIGNGGNIIISTNRFDVLDGAGIFADTRGQGNAGNIQIEARDRINFTRDGGAFSQVRNGARGNGGNITIAARSLNVTEGGLIQATSDAQGDSGTIQLNVQDAIRIAGMSGVFTSLFDDAIGEGGNIDITAGSLSLTEVAQLGTATSGIGRAGDVTIRARNAIVIDDINTNDSGNNGSSLIPSGINSLVNRGAIGNGGNINISADSLFLRNGQIDASTFGGGNSGNVRINVQDRAVIDGRNSILVEQDDGTVAGVGGSGIFSSVEQTVGNGGNIEINTGSLFVINGAQLQVEIDNGRGTAGDIIINARDRVIFSGVVRPDPASPSVFSPSSAFSGVRGENAVGTGGNIEITAGSFALLNDAELDTRTAGRGDAGRVIIQADARVILDDSQIFSQVDQTAVGRGGTIDISTAGRFIVRNGAGLFADTEGQGDGGTIRLAARSLSINDEATLNARTFSTSQGGDITINTQTLNLSDRAQISTSSQNIGQAGNVAIAAHESLMLTNSGITTAAERASGGTITINAGEIQLNEDSDIRTNVESGRNEGGNITLRANSILAFDDSDILAFAQDGRGGNITLDTPAFFGENYQPASDETDPRTLDNNDRVNINAVGVVSGDIRLPDVTFVENSLSELPDSPANSETVIANSCIARTNDNDGSFVITGSGGLSERPGDRTISSYSTGEIQTVPNDIAAEVETNQVWQVGDRIIEPQGIYRLANGQLIMSRECES